MQLFLSFKHSFKVNPKKQIKKSTGNITFVYLDIKMAYKSYGIKKVFKGTIISGIEQILLIVDGVMIEEAMRVFRADISLNFFVDKNRNHGIVNYRG